MSDERRAAFEAEALPHLGRIWAAACRFLPQPADAEDLLQETYLRAYRKFDSFARGTNCRAWLLTILYSVFVNRYHRQRHEPTAVAVEELEARAQRVQAGEDWEAPLLAATAAGAWGVGKTVETALRGLQAPFREAILMVDVEELTYEEAATALGCPVGTVRSRLSRGRRLLAAELAEYARSQGLLGRVPK